MISMIVFLIGVVLLMATLLFVLLKGGGSQGADSADLRVELPEDLRGAKVKREYKVRSKTGRKISGRMDEVWTLPDGLRVPVDIKWRGQLRPFPSDIMQLSVYAYAMRNDGSIKPVADYGYVRIHTPKASKYIRVPLKDSIEVEEAYDLRLAIKQGKTTGKPNGPAGMCNNCIHKKTGRCPRWA